jgi:hypothetical protein
MAKRSTLLFAAVSLAAVGAVSSLTGQDLSATADGPAGHCAFSMKNAWVGPLKACMAPSSPADCDATGKKDENSNAQFAEGACPTEALVGTCKTEKYSLHYYEGDPSGLEIGCGFQQGEWLAPAAK